MYYLVCDALGLRNDDGSPRSEDELPDGLVLLRLLPRDLDHGREEPLVTASVLLGLDPDVEPETRQRG